MRSDALIRTTISAIAAKATKLINLLDTVSLAIPEKALSNVAENKTTAKGTYLSLQTIYTYNPCPYPTHNAPTLVAFLGDGLHGIEPGPELVFDDTEIVVVGFVEGQPVDPSLAPHVDVPEGLRNECIG